MAVGVGNFDLLDLVHLVGRLAPHRPLNQDEQPGCVWCGGTHRELRGKGPTRRYVEGEAGRDHADHFSDCPWVAADLLGLTGPNE